MTKEEMTVKELKEELNKFDDNLIVLRAIDNFPWYASVSGIAQGINELDCCVILDDCDEENN